METTGHLQWAAKRRRGVALVKVCAVLAFGPAVTAWVLWTTTGHPQVASWAAIAGVAAWVPFSFGVGGLVCGPARDQTLTGWNSPLASLARGVVLVPVLAVSPRSVVRTETWVNLAGLVVGVWLVARLGIDPTL